jgi:hypothetical protein
MPPKLRMLLVLYAGDLLERAGRSVELTPLGLAAHARWPAPDYGCTPSGTALAEGEQGARAVVT